MSLTCHVRSISGRINSSRVIPNNGFSPVGFSGKGFKDNMK